ATCPLVGEFDHRRSNSIGQLVETSRACQDSAHGVPASLGVVGRGRLIVLIPRLAEERQPGGQRGELVAPLSDLSHERLRPALRIIDVLVLAAGCLADTSEKLDGLTFQTHKPVIPGEQVAGLFLEDLLESWGASLP